MKVRVKVATNSSKVNNKQQSAEEAWGFALVFFISYSKNLIGSDGNTELKEDTYLVSKVNIVCYSFKRHKTVLVVYA